jgi:hypothetical protein
MPWARSDNIPLSRRMTFLVVGCDIVGMRIAQKWKISNILILYEMRGDYNLQL